MSVIEIGKPEWTNDDLRAQFDAFSRVYADRPISDNAGGMKAPHAFGAWFMIKMIQPQTIIESGVWKGQGTWLLEQACPSADIICLDINFKNLQYRSPKARYIQKDFSLVDFGDIEKNTTLCFFDDHQSALDRLNQMKWKGFRKAIFEDNYPAKRGDCYSLKKIFANAGFVEEVLGAHGLKGRLKRIIQSASKSKPTQFVEPNETHSAELLQNLELYYEFPPLFKETHTRWGDIWDDTNYPTKDPLFASNSNQILRHEALDYTWMCLATLK